MERKNKYELAVKEIISLNCVHSDGDWLYFYDAKLGAWIKHDAKQARRKIRQLLKEIFNDVEFNLAEIKKIEAELQESPDLFLDFTAIKNERWINTCNGMVNIETLQIVLHDKKYYETTYLDFKFNPNASWSDAPSWIQYIHSSLGGNLEGPKVKLLLQLLVYTVSNLGGAKKMFILLGKPHSGKSALLEFIKRIAGTGGYVPLTLTDLSDRFRSGLLEKARLVLNDELPCNGLKHLDLLKKIIAEEDIIIECKGRAPKCFSPKVKLVYAGNQLPTSKEYDFGNAFADRLCILVYPNSIKREAWKLNLVDSLYEERHAIMSLALMQVKELVSSNYNFAEPDDSIKILDSYKKENASVHMFVEDEEFCQLGPECKEHIANLYDAYVMYAKENALTPVNHRVFRQQIFLIDGLTPKKFRLTGTAGRAGVVGIQLKQLLPLSD